MGREAGTNAQLCTIIDAAPHGDMDEAAALQVYTVGASATLAAMPAVNARLAELAMKIGLGPHTRSGAVAPHAKADTSRRPPGRPGARAGHAGHRRAAAAVERIARTVAVEPLTRGPIRDGPVEKARRRRRRIIEDLPENLTVEAVEYQIPRHWCSCCKKHVEPKVSATLPGAAIGHRLAAMTTVLHYGLGLVIDQTRQILGSPLRTNVSAGGLVSLGRRMAEVLLPWYEQIAQKARGLATLHADETGWRVNGQTHWL